MVPGKQPPETARFAGAALSARGADSEPAASSGRGSAAPIAAAYPCHAAARRLAAEAKALPVRQSAIAGMDRLEAAYPRRSQHARSRPGDRRLVDRCPVATAARAGQCRTSRTRPRTRRRANYVVLQPDLRPAAMS